MNEYARYQRQEKRRRRLEAAGAWAVVVLAGTGLAVVGYAALVGFLTIFAGS